MERVLALVLVFAVISSSYGLTETFGGARGRVTVDNGQVGIGEITGGSFGPGSFSIAGPGGASHGLPANAVQHGGPIIINPPNRGGVHHQGNLPPQNGGNFWNAGQNNQVYTQRPQANTGHKGKNKKNKGHKNRKHNKKCPKKPSDVEAISNCTNNEKNGFSNSEFPQITHGQGGNFQGSQGVGFQEGHGVTLQAGQGFSVYPGVGGHGGRGGGLQGGQGATFYPAQGGQRGQGGQGATFYPAQGGQRGQGATFYPAQGGQRGQGGQGATFYPAQGVQGGHGGGFQNSQGGRFRPDQGGNIAIGSITGGTFESYPNIGHTNPGYRGNTYEAFSAESSISAESAEEPEPWVWGFS